MGNVLDKISEVLNLSPAQIVDEAVEGIGNIISRVIKDIFSGLDHSLDNFIQLGPNFSKFYEYLDESIKDTIMNGCMVFGYAVAIILILIYIIQYLVNIGKVKVSPFAMMGRVLIAFILISRSSSLMFYITSTMTNVFQYIFSQTRLGEFSFIDLLMGSFSSDGLNVIGTTIACFATFAPLASLAMLFIVLISWPVIKQFIKYLLEMVERYLICCIVMMLFPAIAPLIILEDTAIVVKSYFRMLGGQMLLLCTSCLFLSGAVVLLQSGQGKESIFGYIFVLGYLRVIQRVDYYLQAMGLNVAQATGMIGDSLAGAAKSVFSGLHAANTGRKSIGEGMQAIGAQMGNKDIFATGAVIGANMKSIAQNGIPNGTNLNKQFLERASKSGSIVSEDAKSAADTLNGFMHSPRNYMGAYNLDQDSLNRGVEHITGMDGVENAKLGLDGTITFDAPDADGEKIRYSLTDTDPGNSMPVLNDYGEPTGFISSGNNITDGNTISGSYDDVLAMAGALDMDTNTDISAESISSISSATKSGRVTSFMNDDGETIAVMDQNNDFLQPAPLINNGAVAENAYDTVTNDIDRLYPGYEYKKRDDGKADIQFDGSSKNAYVEMKSNESANWNKCYIQDSVSKDTVLPPKNDLSNIHNMRHSANHGSHITRYTYGLDRTPATTKKSSVPSDGYVGNSTGRGGHGKTTSHQQRRSGNTHNQT